MRDAFPFSFWETVSLEFDPSNFGFQTLKRKGPRDVRSISATTNAREDGTPARAEWLAVSGAPVCGGRARRAHL
jgi:hypothetical protein